MKTLIFLMVGLLMSSTLSAQVVEGFGRRGRHTGNNEQIPQKASLPEHRASAPQASTVPKAAPTTPQAAPVIQPVQAFSAQKIGEPEVDTAEVIRRGDMVEHVGGDDRFGSDIDKGVSQISALPQNDADKWFVSVITTKNCPACAQLKELWKTDPTLRAYALPEDPKRSWGHYTVYDYNDPYQSWRWKPSAQNPNPIKISAFPTVIVQPPRSQIYGNPRTVVLQYVWEGDPQRMHQAINSSIRAYLATLERKESLIDGKEVVQGGFGSVSADEIYVPLADRGIGQQQVPPLVLPGEDPAQPRNPRQEARMMGAKKQILIVTDAQLVSSDEQESAVTKTVQELQPETSVPVRRVDVKDLPRGIKVLPDEQLPVVMLVEGSDVIARKPVAVPKGWGPVIEGIFLVGFAVKVFGTICILAFAALFVGAIVKTFQALKMLPTPLWGGVAPAPAPSPIVPATAPPTTPAA